MVVAIPRYGEELAPCFEYSATIALFTIRKRRVVDQRVTSDGTNPIVQWVDQQEKTHRQEISFAKNWRLAEKIDLVYDPEEPKRVESLKSDVWLFAIGFTTLGTILVFCGFAWLFFGS